MSTILGIQGRDKNTSETYVVLAADTQWLNSYATNIGLQAQPPKQFDAHKIVIPQQANYVYAFSGLPLNAIYFAVDQAKTKLLLNAIDGDRTKFPHGSPDVCNLKNFTKSIVNLLGFIINLHVMSGMGMKRHSKMS